MQYHLELMSLVYDLAVHYPLLHLPTWKSGNRHAMWTWNDTFWRMSKRQPAYDIYNSENIYGLQKLLRSYPGN